MGSGMGNPPAQGSALAAAASRVCTLPQSAASPAVPISAAMCTQSLQARQSMDHLIPALRREHVRSLHSVPISLQARQTVDAGRKVHARGPPPELLKIGEDLNSVGSPRGRQYSVNSANDSDEERVKATHDSEDCSPCSPQTPQTSMQIVGTFNSSKVSLHNSKETSFKKSRTSFTKPQIQRLEVKFGTQKYLTKLDRTQLAGDLGLTEKHVKTWFQNRRTKWKKDCSDVDWSKHKEVAAALMYNQYQDNKRQGGVDDEGTVCSVCS